MDTFLCILLQALEEQFQQHFQIRPIDIHYRPFKFESCGASAELCLKFIVVTHPKKYKKYCLIGMDPVEAKVS